MMVCSSRALALAGITRNTPDPPGGVIVRDATGEPTGVLKDSAMDAIHSVRPDRTLPELEEALRAAMKEAARSGVTSVQDLPGNANDLDAWESLRSAGALAVRVHYRPSLSRWEKARDRRAAMRNDEWLRIGGVKGFADGSLGSRTALFFEPYVDDPGNRGVFAADAIPSPQARRPGRRGRLRGSPGRPPRHRGPGERRDPESLRSRRQKERSARPPIPYRARAAPASGGHRTFRRPRRGCFYAALPCRGRRPLGREARRHGALPNGLCLPIASRRRGPARLRVRLGCRAPLPASRDRSRRDPPDDRRKTPRRLVPRAADGRRGSPPRLHRRSRLGLLRGGRKGHFRLENWGISRFSPGIPSRSPRAVSTAWQSRRRSWGGASSMAIPRSAALPPGDILPALFNRKRANHAEAGLPFDDFGPAAGCAPRSPGGSSDRCQQFGHRLG